MWVPNGNAIRRLRAAQGWSRRELAERADLDERDLVRIERDEMPDVPAVTIFALAETLGVGMMALMSRRRRHDRPRKGGP